MSVVDVRYAPEEESDIEDDGTNLGNRTASRKFTIVVDNPADTLQTIFASSLLPKKNDPHPADQHLRVRRVGVVQASPIYWRGTAYYEATGSDFGAYPVDEPPSVTFSFVTRDEIQDRDADGNAIATVLGESFDPPEMIEEGDLLITLKKSFLVFDPLLATVYKNVVNSDVFGPIPRTNRLFPPGTLRMLPWEVEPIASGFDFIWRTTVRLVARRGEERGMTDDRAWYGRRVAKGFLVQDRGTDINTRVAPVRTQMYDGAGSIVPVYHDKTTGWPINIKTTPPDWYEFRKYRSLPFGPLGLLVT